MSFFSGINSYVKHICFSACMFFAAGHVLAQDAVADNMLLFQRNGGGWNKHLHEKAVDYKKDYSADKSTIEKNKSLDDATIDNEATTKEIKYLVKAYGTTKNAAYLTAAENGIRFLLKAQYENGGWPQYYPDASGYRSQITFNDNAMVNVLTVMHDITEGKNGFDVVDKNLVPEAAKAVRKGVECILATQIKVNGELTAWCAQYNHTTLQPEMARKFELASISGSESVGIVRFLMRQPEPSPAIQQAVNAAIKWFETVKIAGYNFTNQNTNGKKDMVLVPDAASTIWARFYEIGTNKPFFTGRDSQPKNTVAEIDDERRNGYAWYGAWAANLLAIEYPRWQAKLKKGNN